MGIKGDVRFGLLERYISALIYQSMTSMRKHEVRSHVSEDLNGFY